MLSSNLYLPPPPLSILLVYAINIISVKGVREEEENGVRWKRKEFERGCGQEEEGGKRKRRVLEGENMVGKKRRDLEGRRGWWKEEAEDRRKRRGGGGRERVRKEQERTTRKKKRLKGRGWG